MLKRLLRPVTKAAAPARRSDVLSLELGGRNVELARVRDGRTRRMRLSVDERGARLSLPLRASDAQAEQFVREHAAWVLAQLDALAGADATSAPALLIHQTASLPLWGEQRPLQWLPARHTHVLLAGDGALQFHYSARAGSAALARALSEFYQAQLRADIGPRLAHWLPGLPRAPRRVVFKQMTSQWGSLAPDGTVCLDLSLVLAPPAALEYVLVHELCHLIQANHSPAFWEQVGARLPQWPQQRQWLASEGRRIKHRLRRLLSVA